MKDCLIIINPIPMQDIIEAIINSDIMDERLLIDNMSQLKNLKAKHVIICHYNNKMITNIKELLEKNGTHGLAISTIDLMQVHRLCKDRFTECVLILLEITAIRLRGSQLDKLTPFMLRGKEMLNKRDFIKSMFKGFVSYRDFPTINNSCLAKDGCAICINACPYDALYIENNVLKLSEINCVECGLCTTICPDYSIQLPLLPEIIQSLMIDKLSMLDDVKIVFTCKYGISKDLESENTLLIEIPCIAAFSHVALIESLKRGMDISLVCPNEDCDLRSAAKLYNKITSIFGDGIVKIVNDINNNDIKNIRRRDRLKLDIDPLNEKKRDIIAKYLAEYSNTIREKELPFFNIVFNEDNCILCEACAVHCSTKALNVSKDGNVLLTFEHSKCIGCMECEKVCSTNAIKIIRELNSSIINKPIILKKSKLNRCILCNKEVEFSDAMIDTKIYCSSCKAKTILEGL